MTPSRCSSPRLLGALALVLAAFCAPRLAHATALEAYYERTVMNVADQRCRLFSPGLSSALAMARAQARGAALRSGASNALINQVADRARDKVGAVPCNSPDLAKAADRVRAAFDGYSKLEQMRFPGTVADWSADRSISLRSAIWKLSQPARTGSANLVFGLAGQGDVQALAVAASFPDNARPYGARLVMRDASLAPEPFLNVIQAGNDGRMPLSARMPPRNATQAFMADARGAADTALLPPGARSGILFRFPADAAAALANLDPREAVAIEFLIPTMGADQVRTVYIEVGDFAAGRAFLTDAQR